MGKITYHERPWIEGKRNWRSLGFAFTPQSSLKLAREEYHRRLGRESVGQDPYAEKLPPAPAPSNPAPKSSGPEETAVPAASAVPVATTSHAGEPTKTELPQKLSISGVLKKYRDDGFLDKFLRKREGRTLDMESRNCDIMPEYFDGRPWDDLLPPLWDNYKDWRVERPSKKDLERIEKEKRRKKAGLPAKKRKKKKGKKEIRTRHRTVDQDRNTMVNACRHAIRRGLIDINRAHNLPKFQPASEVRHCREFAPRNVDELHQIAELLFSERATEVLAWQLLIEGITGQRTEEILMLRTDAKPDEPGFIRPDGNMDVFRPKEGANPYVFIHDGLKTLLKLMLFGSNSIPQKPMVLSRPGRPK